MAFTVTSIAPEVVSVRGGDQITAIGTFDIAEELAVTVNGVAAFSGLSGAGRSVFSVDGTSISFVAPASENIGDHDVVITGAVDVAGAEIIYVRKTWISRMFSMRSSFPSWYGLGARRLDIEPLQAQETLVALHEVQEAILPVQSGGADDPRWVIPSNLWTAIPNLILNVATIISNERLGIEVHGGMYHTVTGTWYVLVTVDGNPEGVYNSPESPQEPTANESGNVFFGQDLNISFKTSPLAAGSHEIKVWARRDAGASVIDGTRLQVTRGFR